MEFLYEYGLFVAKAATLVIAFVVVVSTIVGVASKQKQGKGQLEIVSISEQLKDITNYAKQVLLDKNALKKLAKEQKKEEKAKSKEKGDDTQKSRLYVIDFKGSMDPGSIPDNFGILTRLVMKVLENKGESMLTLNAGQANWKIPEDIITG